MKKIISLILSLVMILSFTACGTKTEAGWQEHYDLGVKYVNEAKYDEAILAFTKALEIDPKQATVYIALAEVYVRQENYTAAQETLDKAITEIGETDELTTARDKALQAEHGDTSSENGTNTNKEPIIVRTEKIDLSDGSWWINEFDKNDNLIKSTKYNSDGSVSEWYIDEYDENGNSIKSTAYNSDGDIYGWVNLEYDKGGNCIKRTYYNADGTIDYWYTDEYYENGYIRKHTEYNADGTIKSVSEY